MTVNTSLLIAAPILQDYFVDKLTGFPLAGGIVSLYEDTDHTTYKNWYYQTGSAGGPYNFQTLENPLTLSSVGTITDPFGNDVIPYFYPYDEDPSSPLNTIQKYYIVVTDSNGTVQFTRDNFPYNINSGSPTPSSNGEQHNLIVNNEFWRNIGQLSINSSTPDQYVQPAYQTINNIDYKLYTYALAPSQHDNFIVPDICLIKNSSSSTDVVTFANFVLGRSSSPTLTPYIDQILPNSITPEFYMNFNCSASGTESFKYIQIPIQSNITALSGAGPYSVSICAMALTGMPQITISIFQFRGTGVNSLLPLQLGTISLTNDWQKYEFSGTNLPSSQNLSPGTSLGLGQDDGFYLIISLPSGNASPGSQCNINIALPSFYLSDKVPTNDWKTYDQINTVISSPKTGEVTISANKYYQFGWVPMNDGVIGAPASSVIPISTRAIEDTWPLYNRLWQDNVILDTGGNFNPICQMFAANGTLTPTNYGSSAYDDFVAGKGLQLTQTFGRVIAGTVPPWYLLSTQVQSVTASGASSTPLIFTISPLTFYLYNGQPVYFTATGGTLPGNILPNVMYYVTNINAAGNIFNVAISYDLAVPQAPNVSPTPVMSTGSPGSNVKVSPNYSNIYDGENAHWQQTNEVGSHTHTASTTLGLSGSTGGSPTTIVGTSGAPITTITPVTTVNASSLPTQAINIRQLEAYYNIFMKL
jgi:hypothetical protein